VQVASAFKEKAVGRDAILACPPEEVTPLEEIAHVGADPGCGFRREMLSQSQHPPLLPRVERKFGGGELIHLGVNCPSQHASKCVEYVEFRLIPDIFRNVR
jgi:hypothetical protein